jgi:hypothetical protein
VRFRRTVRLAVTGLSLAAALVAVTAVSASARPQATRTLLKPRNLLKNGNAELGPGSRDRKQVVAKIPGWQAAVDDRGGQFNVLAYENISPKDAQRGNFWPSTAASRLIKGGNKLFVGGYMAPGRTASTLTQSVNVAGQRKAIDAGKRSATLAAYLGGIGNTKDSMTVVAAFRDANGKRLGFIRVGPVAPDEWDKVFSNRGHSTALIERKGTKNVPKGTRSIVVVLQTIKRDGAYSDAIADNISLTLGPSEKR